MKGIRIQEKKVQEILADYYSKEGYVVKREVKTPVGVIDLLLFRNMGLRSYEKVMIEVKELKSIKHAIGQLLSYREYHTDVTKLLVVYFTRNGKYEGIDSIFQNHKQIEFQYIGNLVEISKLCQTEEVYQEKVEKEKVRSSRELMKSMDLTSLNIDSIQEELLEYQADLGISIGTSLDNITF